MDIRASTGAVMDLLFGEIKGDGHAFVRQRRFGGNDAQFRARVTKRRARAKMAKASRTAQLRRRRGLRPI